jgi:hypothetical protein
MLSARLRFVSLCVATIAAAFSMLGISCGEAPTASILRASLASVRTDVTGVVRDDQGAPLAGVSVRLGAQGAMTDQLGCFRIASATVTRERMVVTAKLPGYFDATAAERPEVDGVTAIALTLRRRLPSHEIDARAGGTVDAGDLTFTFPPRAITYADGRRYEGTATIHHSLILRTDSLFAIEATSDAQALRNDSSLAMINRSFVLQWELRSPDDVPLVIGFDASVTLSIAAPGAKESEAWRFSDAKGVWVEAGIAQHRDGRYIVSVPSTGTLTVGRASAPIVVTGRVVCHGMPTKGVAGLVVDVGGSRTTTRADGYLEYRVSSAEPGEISIPPQVNLGVWAPPSSIVGSVADTLRAGMIRLAECPAVVKGRLVDEQGRPVPGMLVVKQLGRALTVRTDSGGFSFAVTAGLPLDIRSYGLGQCPGTPTWLREQSAGSIVEIGDLPICTLPASPVVVDVAISPSTESISALALSQRGETVALGGGETGEGIGLQFRSGADGTLIRSASGDPVRTISFCARYQRLIVSHIGATGPYVRGYAGPDWAPLHEFPMWRAAIAHPGGVWFLALAQTSDFAGIARAQFKPASNSAPITTRYPMRGWPAAFCDRELSFITVEEDVSSRITVWRFDGLQKQREILYERRITPESISTSSDGTIMAIRFETDSIAFINTLSGRRVSSRPGTMRAFALGPDNRSLATAEGIVDLESNELLHRLPMPSTTSMFRLFAFSHDGTRLAAIYHDETGATRLRIWEIVP